MRPLTLSLVALLFLSVSSCTPGPLEGDWFQCEDDTCATLDDNGVRFTADGRWGALDAPGGELEPGEGYELEGPRGTYSLDGETLTIRVDGTGEAKSVRISFDGDDLLIHDVEQGAVACAQPAPPAGGDAPPPTCEEQTELKTLRFRRVADAGEVPTGGGTVMEDDTVSTAPGYGSN